MKNYKGDLKEIFLHAANSADPRALVRERIYCSEGAFMSGDDFAANPAKIFLFALGKAACLMADGFLSVCGVDKGVVASNNPKGSELFPQNIKYIKAGHPLPDEGSITAAREMLALADEADEDTLCVFLVSGGGSAILCAPSEGITLADKMRTSDVLIKSGAAIEEINAVRKHLSDIKGGKLLKKTYPAASLTMAISDVISGEPDAIASGVSYYDNSTWADALEAVLRYRLKDKLPASVIDRLRRGAEGELEENLQKDNYFSDYEIIGSNHTAMIAAYEKAIELGYDAVMGQQFTCDVKEAAELVSEVTNQTTDRKPKCFIFGGEVTVRVQGGGMGGRCQQFAAEYLISRKTEDTVALFASTDGMDGDTDAAGAFCEDIIYEDTEIYAERNDTYNFFKINNGLFKTGLTGTNVNDLYMVIIPSGREEHQLQALASERSCN